MHVLNVRNVHEALAQGLELISNNGISRRSDNPLGSVQLMHRVTTVYERPEERLTFWNERDINTAFLVYEALWMLAGRNDLEPLTRYVSDFGRFSDNGVILHGAYGYRWRRHFGIDQLSLIANGLKDEPDNRRMVLGIWDPRADLAVTTRDAPCNDTVVFERDEDGRLDMTVFCRSNDILWGAYFANAFHFSVLQEYMARWIGCPLGVYTQISVNWHLYDKTSEGLTLPLTGEKKPYDDRGAVYPARMSFDKVMQFDFELQDVLKTADADVEHMWAYTHAHHRPTDPFLLASFYVLWAHSRYRAFPPPERFAKAREVLSHLSPFVDLGASMYRWLGRRERRWEEKMMTEKV